ncbi:MAG: histidine phosphatase family protein [Streptosporangiales bacterium]|nr:histidine phosphatase family protein [Streptosporangiales bacterium]
MTAAGTRTVVHLVRHGEVHNPAGVLYGRLPEFHLSEAGRSMAERVATWFAGRAVGALYSSPLVRARETAAPLADATGMDVEIDLRLIEPWNHFEGLTFGVGDGSLRHPRHWPYLLNPLRPSWGEPYREVVARMRAAIARVRTEARGGEAVCVSHQLPIEVTRRALQGDRLWHRPDRRQCGLASVTSLTYFDDQLVSIDYAEPATDLLVGRPDQFGA